ncbi:Dyp-type peroxidase [Galbitalea sp. SE-J8]|uniref:Dyp-type peroxidase n=1 Tax=Galbitalea sp. SE-J8 TaxID=3054952 RepID=UPI00259D1FFE|nr:Dyp-type peroxidase [Galbitalea sp. SE-J8]MDM4763027.1 Dyp-type peroxidase [Galbitalea sp. SE-J8]
MDADAGRRVPIEPQKVDAPLTRSSIFLILSVADGDAATEAVRDGLGSVSDLTKNVAFRDLGASLAITVGIGSRVWERIMGAPGPRELHPFRVVAGAVHTAVATPGDLLFHIRSDRYDLCFEFERQLLDTLGDSVTVADETVGFRYFDTRDLLGFVDGTANPVGPAVPASTLVGDEDPAFAGGSYVVAQKYLHDTAAWASLTTEQQEAIIGRRKADNTELDDAVSGQKSHKTLSTIEDDEGEHDILRDNMPFGTPGSGAFGTYFIGYSRHLWVTERMLERMFIGDPPGLHDRLLDFSTPVVGCTFFAPTAGMLDALGG